MKIMTLQRRKLGITLTFFLTLIIFSLFVWYSRATFTGEAATVVKVSESHIEVRNLEGRSTTVSIPKGVSKLIQIDHEYFIQYEKRSWQQPNLVSIEPFPNK